MKVGIFYALILIPLASAGVISPITPCNPTGAGTLLQLRVDECDTQPCHVMPGRVHNIEADFVPSVAHPQCAMKISLNLDSLEFVILEILIPNSPVNPGQMYTLRYPLTPDEVLAGRILDLTLKIHGTSLTGIMEICAKAPVVIVRP